MDLDLAAVRAFVAVVDEEQFSHAAVVLGISQQAVSKRIAKLEAQLGADLLERSPGRIALTLAGIRLLPHARTLLATTADAVAAVQAKPRPLRVAVFGERIAPIELMRFYFAQNPHSDTEMVMPNNEVTSTRDALVAGRVDAAFARAHGGPEALPEHILACPAYLEPMHLLVGKDHPLAPRSSVTLHDIAAHGAWVSGTAIPSEWTDFYRSLTEFSGITIETGGCPVGFAPMVDRIAASSRLATFVGEGGRTPWNPHSRQLNIIEPTPAYPWSLLWSTANDHPELPNLIDHFTANYNEDMNATCWIPDTDRALFAQRGPTSDYRADPE